MALATAQRGRGRGRDLFVAGQWSLSSTLAEGRTTLADTVPTGYGRPRGDAGAYPVDETVTFRPPASGPGSVMGVDGRRVTHVA